MHDRRLEAKLDELRGCIDGACEVFKAVRPVMSTAVDLDDERKLRWTKKAGRWGLFVVEPDEGGVERHVALDSAGLEARVLASHKLEELHEALLKTQRDMVELVDETIERVHEFVLRHTPRKPAEPEVTVLPRRAVP